MLNRNVLFNSYFTRDKLVHHHINSFNEFIDRGLQKVIDEVGTIETNIENTYVRLGKIRVERPMVREADGSIERLYPNDARLRNLTYASPIKLEMIIVEGETEKEPVEAEIGTLPIMLNSKVCNLSGMSPDEMIAYGEDPMDPGGYFVVNGSERVIMTLEDLAPNKILVEYNQRYDEFIEVAKVFSQRQGYRSLVIVERGRRSILEVSFPSVSGRLNFVTLLRALGMETDMDIVKAVSDNPEIIKFMLENLEEAEVSTMDEALEKIGGRVAAGQAKEYQKKRATYVLDRYLLPHIGVAEKRSLCKGALLGTHGRGLLRAGPEPQGRGRQGPLLQQEAEALRRSDGGPLPGGLQQSDQRHQVPAGEGIHEEPRAECCDHCSGRCAYRKDDSSTGHRQLGWRKNRRLPASGSNGLHGHPITFAQGDLATLPISASLRGQGSSCHSMGTDLSQRDP